MTETDLISVYFEALTVANANFEFWLTATFAFIVAFHFVGADISKGLTRILIVLYLLTAVVFNLRYVNAGLIILDTVALLEEADTQIDLQGIGALVTGPLINLVMIIGTGAAMYFANKAGTKGGRREPST
jgi:hypothetical protein